MYGKEGELSPVSIQVYVYSAVDNQLVRSFSSQSSSFGRSKWLGINQSIVSRYLKSGKESFGRIYMSSENLFFKRSAVIALFIYLFRKLGITPCAGQRFFQSEAGTRFFFQYYYYPPALFFMLFLPVQS